MKTTKQFNKQINPFRMVSKHLLLTFVLSALMLTSCTKSDGIDNDCDGDCDQATAAEFNNIKDTALDNLTQTFQFDAADGAISLTSEKGVSIYINTSCLTLNGNAITGTIDLDFVEIFDKGSMLTTNKPTMGIMPNGDKALLLTGGEFFMEATQNGATLDTSCDIQIGIPADLTGGVDNTMIMWNGIIDDDGNLAWEAEERGTNNQGGVFAEGNQYYAFLSDFGWSNVDRFYNDPRPKTTILVDVPEGYNNTNCSIFLSYDGENTGLAGLDTYDPVSGLFSEHYGQIPVGLECHVIFVSEENENWKYAVQAATIVENGVITISDTETAVVTQAQLTTIINGLP